MGSCQGVGLGGYSCDSGPGLGWSAVILIGACAAAPALTAALLHRWGYRHFVATAVLAYIFGVIGSYVVFGSALGDASPGLWLLWEVATIGLFVPAIGLGIGAVAHQG
jgi:hypothetical protein